MAAGRPRQMSVPETKIPPAAARSMPADAMGGPQRQLPVPLTPLVGRETDIAEVSGLLEDGRLVTLTGPGGVGKTRVAIAVAEHLPSSLTGGVRWVGLAAVLDAEGIGTAVCEALGVRGRSVQGSFQDLIQQLKDRRILLVLDNCEQLVAGCADLCADLLMWCPGLRVLATSRERLGLTGERVWPIAPLPVPRCSRQPADVLHEAPAVDLFVARCRDAVPDFALTPDNADAVLRVCRRMDGIPLAIELAAARIPVLGAAQLAEALDRSPDLLGDRGRGPQRHRTLRDTLAWSYDLLSSAEQDLFRRICVFGGQFDLDAATSVAAGSDAENVVDLLGRLVDKSLVQVSRSRGAARYRLLSTVRDYGRRRLSESGDPDAVALAHLTHFTRLAEEAEPRLTGEGGPAELDRLELDGSNLRAALTFAKAHGEHVLGARLAAALWPLCYLRGLYREGRRWLDWAVEAGSDAPAPVLAKALRGSGTLAFLQCDYQAAVDRLEASLHCYRELDDHRAEAEVLLTLGSVAREQARYRDAQGLYAESRRLSVQAEDRRGVARADNYLGFIAWLQGDLDAADDLCAATLPTFRAVGDSEGIAWSLLSQGVAAQYRGDLATATRLLAECNSVARADGYREGVAWSEHELGIVARREGRYGEARDRLLEALASHRYLGDQWRTAAVLEDLAATTAEEDPFHAATLLGAAAALRDAIGAPLAPVECPDHDATVHKLRQLTGDRFQRTVAWGRQRSVDDLVIGTAHSSSGTGRDDNAWAAAASSDSDPSPDGRSPSGTSAGDPWLRMQAFGGARVQLAGRELSSPWWYAKPRELLYLLADGVPRAKEQLADALWPEASPSQLRNSLHTALRDLRRAVQRPDWFVFQDGSYRFVADEECRYDVAEFLAALAAARAATGEEQRHQLRLATDLYAGDFLPEQTAAWVVDRRAELAARNRAALMALGRSLLEARLPSQAVPIYRRAIALDALEESAYRGLMTAYGRTGDHARAAKLYRELAERLRAELDVDPATTTTALYHRIVD
ncbi:gas vesicle protein GvpC [Microlunatus elymi]|uniref:Gas vesicle protein C n=1 Tax=Microlunatus elymi TaxID=2596828 RepID=A0A516PXV6_9ACTN|nr:gas vesicle protein GvpC [Microlunatus elymi]QDP96010.1 gas vesicle protein GvpC [Microlunatus elymi]